MQPVNLVGQLCRLRDFSASDLDDVLAIVGDDRVTRWLSYDTRDRPQAEAMLSGIIERSANIPRNEYYLAITPLESSQMIGFARLGLDGVQAAKLGYAVRYQDWGRGIATDAAKSLVEFGFRDLSLHRISAATAPDNTASSAVAKNLGFQYEGRIRHHVFTNGEWRDSLLYSMLVDEWRSAEVNKD